MLHTLLISALIYTNQVQPVHSGAQTAQNDTAAPIQEIIKPIQQVIQSIQQVVDQTIQKVEPTEMRKKKNNTALQRLVDDMLHADEDKPYSKIDWGKQMNGTNDESPNPLIAEVDERIFEKAQYQALIQMYSENLFTPNVCDEEQQMQGVKMNAVQNVFDTFTKTPMFNIAFTYLQNHGIASDWNSFRQQLWNLWMGTYSRCHQTVQGSSGFEHIYCGEWKGREVDGQHDWVKYYLLQKAGQINYHGYQRHAGASLFVQDLIGSFQYTWNDHLKKLGGFYLGTSPAFDFSLFTVCALTEPGSNRCRFKIDDYSLSVTTYTQTCDGGICLATAYPVN
uniref:Endoribonuclease n=1 Tax=Ascaris lumbricoides TaxID=6252 RepID=A0A9J2PHF4_ASCLU